MAALLADVRESLAIGLVVDQAYVNRLSERHGVDAPVLAPTAAEIAKAKEADDARAAKAQEVVGLRATMAEAEDFALRRRLFFAEARECREAGIPIDQGFLDELSDRHRVPRMGLLVGREELVMTGSQREAQLAVLSREITASQREAQLEVLAVLAREITTNQADESVMTASELDACKAAGCTPEEFLAARRAQRAGPSR